MSNGFLKLSKSKKKYIHKTFEGLPSKGVHETTSLGIKSSTTHALCVLFCSAIFHITGES